MLLGPLKPFTMSVSRSRDGFLLKGAIRQPVACARGLRVPQSETRLLFARPDVSDFMSLSRDVPTGFRFLARAAGRNEASRDATIELTASWNGDGPEYLIGEVSVRLVPARLQKRHFGDVVFPGQSRLLHRENIYGSRPPVLEQESRCCVSSSTTYPPAVPSLTSDAEQVPTAQP